MVRDECAPRKSSTRLYSSCRAVGEPQQYAMAWTGYAEVRFSELVLGRAGLVGLLCVENQDVEIPQS